MTQVDANSKFKMKNINDDSEYRPTTNDSALIYC